MKYFKYQNSNDFDFLKNWEVAFEDEFAEGKLDKKKWSTCHSVAEKLLGENYALPGDLNIFTNGENIQADKKLKIQVKKEKAPGKVWKMPAGFVPVEFDYTSGLVSSEKSWQFSDGIVEAKIKFDPYKQIISSFSLEGEKAGNRVNLLEMGARNHVGTSTLNSQGKVHSSGLEISNLKKGEYIFTLEKQGSTFTWKINETEVLKEDHSDMNLPMHLVASSLVIDEIPASSLPASFEISWVKCYSRK